MIINTITCRLVNDSRTVWKDISGRKFVYLGDGNNMSHAWLIMGAIGCTCCHGYSHWYVSTRSRVIETAQIIAAQSGGKVEVLHDPETAARNASVLYTDVWMSMGDSEDEREEKVLALSPFAVTENLMSLTQKDSVFMHCLPAHRGEEVEASVIDGTKSLIWREAYHRRTTIQSLLYHLIRGDLQGSKHVFPHAHSRTKEIREGEKRVALVPDIINKLTRLGFDVVIESGAGVLSQATDADYVNAGATISNGEVLSTADAVLSVQPLTPTQIATLKKGAITVSFMSTVTAVDSIDAAAAAGVTAFSLELVPRISRAQSMDALSSQALCAGYRAALVGAELSPRFFPMLMTAAGTVTPAQVLFRAGVQVCKRLQLRVA